MSREPKVWPVLLVSAIMVLSIATLMFAVAENEPSEPQLPDDYQLRYSAVVVYENRTVTGTQTHNQTGSSGELWPYWEEDGYWGPTAWTGGSGGWMIEEIQQETAWGTRFLRVCVEVGWGESPDFIVVYRGSHSGIVYRREVVTPEYRATFVLTGVNFTEFLDMDLKPSGREPFQGYDDYFPDHPHNFNLSGGANLAMAKVEPGHDWYRLNMTNFAYVHFSQENVWSMVNGGDYRYDLDRSLIGNGTLRFQAVGDWYIRVLGPFGDGPHTFVMDCALTEEE